MHRWLERDAKVVWHGFTQMERFAEDEPLIVERAEGHELIDTEGKRYIDAVSSLWINTLGHRVAELDDAIREQLGRVAQTCLIQAHSRQIASPFGRTHRSCRLRCRSTLFDVTPYSARW